MALKFTRIDQIIIKKKERWWLKLVCWHFSCYLDGLNDHYQFITRLGGQSKSCCHWLYKSFGHFFLPANWESASTGQSLSSSVQSLPNVFNLLTYGKENSMVMRRVRAWHCMFEGGNFVKSKSDTCDQYPLKTLQPHGFCDSVTEPSLSTSVGFIYYFVFEETVFAYYNLHFVCAHTKKQTWPFLPEICYSIVSAWS